RRARPRRDMVAFAAPPLAQPIKPDARNPRRRTAVPPQAVSEGLVMDWIEAADGLILSHFSHRSAGKNTCRPDSSTVQEHHGDASDIVCGAVQRARAEGIHELLRLRRALHVGLGV